MESKTLGRQFFGSQQFCFSFRHTAIFDNFILLTLDKETANYIVTYFSHLLTEKEKLAVRHSSSIIKIESGDKTTNLVSLTKIYKERGWLTDDQTVLDLLKDGCDNFELKTAQRILKDYGDKVFLNNCPKCGKLARTPRAKFCRHCGHDWHEK